MGLARWTRFSGLCPIIFFPPQAWNCLLKTGDCCGGCRNAWVEMLHALLCRAGHYTARAKHHVFVPCDTVASPDVKKYPFLLSSKVMLWSKAGACPLRCPSTEFSPCCYIAIFRKRDNHSTWQPRTLEEMQCSIPVLLWVPQLPLPFSCGS